jgi:WD40 repeat protein
VAAALMGALAVFGLAGLDRGDVVEVRVQGRTSGFPELPAFGDTSTTTAGPAADPSGRVVWADHGDIWLYETGTRQRRRLTHDGAVRHDSQPRFRDSTRITYLSSTDESGPDPALVEYSLSNGRSRTLQRLPGYVGAYDWSPDGTTLAYYGAASEGSPTELRIDGDGGRPDRIRRFSAIQGRGGYVNYDETRVEWSPDGRRLLVQDTALDTSQDHTLYILDADGRDAVAPRLGTWARWSAGGQRVYCLCTPATALAPAAGECTWQAIDITTAATTPLPIPAGARPSLSPDGRFLAYDDGEDTPGVHVLDLRSPASRPRLLASAAIAPVWLNSSRLAVTDTRRCPHTEDICLAGGHGSMFEPAGTASALDVPTGPRTPHPLTRGLLRFRRTAHRLGCGSSSRPGRSSTYRPRHSGAVRWLSVSPTSITTALTRWSSTPGGEQPDSPLTSSPSSAAGRSR